jgi:hypothetical protein
VRRAGGNKKPQGRGVDRARGPFERRMCSDFARAALRD